MDSPTCMCVASRNATPFLLSVQDALLLDRSDEFQTLRRHLGKTNEFCHEHDETDHAAWIVIRDILHALLAPVVALYEHSSGIARGQSLRPDDLEYAFSGQARNAFVWLQSFLSTERDWCLSRGCPACIVLQALDGEAPLRLIIASCLLSAQTSDGPTLPSLDFFIRSIGTAMTDDRLWGLDFYTRTERKASALHDAMQDLMYQCRVGSPPVSPGVMMPVKRSTLAEKQAKMQREEAMWLRKLDSPMNVVCRRMSCH